MMFEGRYNSNHDPCMEPKDIDALSDFTRLTWSTAPVGEPNYLSWRMDKQSSFSDWKLEIRVLGVTAKMPPNSEPRIDAYYVHRNVLGVGDRKSGYFQELFQQRGLDNSVTQLEFSERVANSMPMFLDYLYSADSFEIKTENAVPLGYLAQCLSVPTLHEEVKAFIRKDVCFSNAACYLADAVSYKDDETATRVLDVCLQEVIAFCSNSPIQTKLLPNVTEGHVKTLCVLGNFPNVIVGYVKRKTPSFPSHVVDRIKNRTPRFPRKFVDKIKNHVPYV